MPKAKAVALDDKPRRRGNSRNNDRKPGVGGRLLALMLRRPKDTLACTVALAAIVAILVNVLVLQHGRHPSPMFGPNTVILPAAPASVSPLPKPRPMEAEQQRAAVQSDEPAPVPEARPDAARAAPAEQAATPRATPVAVTRSKDPLADIITANRRTAGVQRALTEFGYGQLKPTGVAGTDTAAAIQKFERDRKLPVTGKVSDRLVRELSAMTGRAID